MITFNGRISNKGVLLPSRTGAAMTRVKPFPLQRLFVQNGTTSWAPATQVLHNVVPSQFWASWSEGYICLIGTLDHRAHYCTSCITRVNQSLFMEHGLTYWAKTL